MMIAMIVPAMPSAARTYEASCRRSHYKRHNTSFKNCNYFLLHNGHLTNLNTYLECQGLRG